MIMEARSRKRITGLQTRVRDRLVRQADMPALPGPSVFSTVSVPDTLWPDLLAEFGCDYVFHAAEGDEAAARGIWFEGDETESVFPGRYSRLWVDPRDLPRDPQSADWIVIGEAQFDVERVADTPTGMMMLVLKLA
jgi:hypothetical protein